MLRALLKLALIVVVILAAGAFFLGYRLGDDGIETPVSARQATPGIDTAKARQTGAAIGEKVATGAAQAGSAQPMPQPLSQQPAWWCLLNRLRNSPRCLRPQGSQQVGSGAQQPTSTGAAQAGSAQPTSQPVSQQPPLRCLLNRPANRPR